MQVFPNLRQLNGQVIQSQPQIMQEDTRATLMTDFGTQQVGAFSQKRHSEDIMINMGSHRSGGNMLSETAIEKQANLSYTSITSHDSVTSNYKKKRLQSMTEHQIGSTQQNVPAHVTLSSPTFKS